jgi:hypothetical protein
MSPLASDASNPVTQWRNYIDPLRTNLVQVHANRMMYQELIAATETHSATSRTWTWRNHYAYLYVQGQMMAVRRLIRGNRTQFSLSGLLGSIEEHSEALTLDLVIAMAREYEPARLPDDVAREFQTEWCNAECHFDASIPRRDLNTLFRERRSILAWADQTIAHIDPRASRSPTFGDLDQAIGHVTEVFQRYGRLVMRTHYAVDQILLDPNWREALSRPIFPGSTG